MVYGQTGVCIDVASQVGDVVLGFVAAIMVFDVFFSDHAAIFPICTLTRANTGTPCTTW